MESNAAATLIGLPVELLENICTHLCVHEGHGHRGLQTWPIFSLLLSCRTVHAKMGNLFYQLAFGRTFVSPSEPSITRLLEISQARVIASKITTLIIREPERNEILTPERDPLTPTGHRDKKAYERLFRVRARVFQEKSGIYAIMLSRALPALKNLREVASQSNAQIVATVFPTTITFLFSTILVSIAFAAIQLRALRIEGVNVHALAAPGQVLESLGQLRVLELKLSTPRGESLSVTFGPQIFSLPTILTDYT